MSPLSTPRPETLPRPDRRTRPRKRIATSATVMAGGRLVDGVAVDVSFGGVKVVSPTALEPGARVSIVLIVAGEIVDATATVCWSAPHGPEHHAAGLAFEQVEHEARVHLAKFCGVRLS